MTRSPRRVLVVEDSPVTARILADLLSQDCRFEVAPVACDGTIALEYLKQNSVDVLTLDVNMPNLGGLETLREVIRLHRIPCVMVSSATKAGARTTLDSRAAGAVDFFAKPAGDNPAALYEQAQLLRDKVFAASLIDLTKLFADRPELLRQNFVSPPQRDLVLMGSSTGGPRTLETILQCFPSDLPAKIVIAQHLPVGFVSELAARLNAACQVSVRVAKNGSELKPGVVYLAPGGTQTTVVGSAGALFLRVTKPPALPRSTPSVDALFQSVVSHGVAAKTVAVLLTGMGEDGAIGMKALHDAGAVTLAESEASSIVYGMPKAAIDLGVVRTVVSKDLMAEEILHRMMV